MSRRDSRSRPEVSPPPLPVCPFPLRRRPRPAHLPALLPTYFACLISHRTLSCGHQPLQTINSKKTARGASPIARRPPTITPPVQHVWSRYHGWQPRSHRTSVSQPPSPVQLFLAGSHSSLERRMLADSDAVSPIYGGIGPRLRDVKAPTVPVFEGQAR